MEFSIDILALIVAIVASFVIAFIWYSPMLFGNIWMKEMGWTKAKMDKDLKENGMAKEMVAAVVSTILMVFVLSHFLQIAQMIEGGNGYVMTFWIWLGFFATTLLDGVLWEKKSVKVWLINISQKLASLFAAALILMNWPW